MKKYLVTLLFVAMLAVSGSARVAGAQTTTSGDIAGSVTDPTGAAIPGATVTILNIGNGVSHTITSNSGGSYRASLLTPGQYKVTITSAGFDTTALTVTVNQGQITSGDAKLAVGKSSTVVEVSETGVGMLNTEDANLATSFTLEQIQSVPNPGGDITYVAQTAPGVVMNTGGGYGNFSAFGLPAASNNFTVNGMQVNDPFLNLNNSGPSNLLLGLNDIADVSVVTNAYDPSFGSFAGAQVNATSRAGVNKFHGSARYWWNGDVLNANNWFNNNDNPTQHRPHAVSNQYAGSIGGPILHDKTFFFANYEGLTFVTSVPNILYVPSAAYESGVLGTNGSCNNSTSELYAGGNGGTANCNFYKQVFNLYNGTPGYSSGTTVTSGGSPTGQVRIVAAAKTHLTEKLLTARVDQILGDNDKAFIHFKYDKGTQPTYSDPINPTFNITSVQPDFEGQVSESHTFGAKAVNVFLITGSYYSAIFDSPTQAAANALLPMTLNFSDVDAFFTNLNADQFIFPQGRNVTQYQAADDFSYNVGKHTLKFGVAFKKDDVSDHDPGELTTPLVITDSIYGDFEAGYADVAIQNFPTTVNTPISLYSLGFYGQDDIKLSSKVSVMVGLRAERNSNPSSSRNVMSNFGGDFAGLAASPTLSLATAPFNQQIHTGLNKAFTSYQAVELEPRVGFNWEFNPKAVLSGGYGLFTDVFPATIADDELFNAPLTPEFETGGGITPGLAGSSNTAAIADNTAFQKGFKSGGSFATIGAAPNMTTVSTKLHYPTYNEYNLKLQYEISHTNSIQIGYVGNKDFHEPVQNGNSNAYSTSSSTSPYPTTAPLASFGAVNEIDSTGVSNYNGLITSFLHHGNGLTMQLNYTYSHNLDEISNGGLLPFSGSSLGDQLDPKNLHSQYGNSDYDVRHNVNGNLLYVIPYFGGPKLATDGWEISGTLFVHSGLPFTPTEYIGNFVGNVNALEVPVAVSPTANITSHHCGSSHINVSNGSGSPCLTASQFNVVVDDGGTSTSFLTGAHRNQFFGPGYFDTDMTVQKAFHLGLPGFFEASQLKIGVSAYNVLNHPNFANPSADVNDATFGLSSGTVSPPTSIYGAFLGGDSSVRILQAMARFDF